MTRPNTQVMNRAALTARIAARCTAGEAIIGGIGNTNWDLWAAGARAENFYMLGSMGLALPIALGVALAQPARRVLALEGDGSLLMQLGCLATIAAQAPRNLAVFVWDNGQYQITGGQETPARAAGTDLVAMARAAGLARAHWAADEAGFEALLSAALASDGPHLVAARIDGEPGRVPTPREPVRHASAFVDAMAREAG